jgi:hypothetical protein
VNAHDSKGEILHPVLEAKDIGIVFDEIYNHLVPGLVGGLGVDVATRAVGIAAEAIGLRVRWYAFRRRLYRAQIDLPTASISPL